jgi:hypothetical protein
MHKHPPRFSSADATQAQMLKNIACETFVCFLKKSSFPLRQSLVRLLR